METLSETLIPPFDEKSGDYEFKEYLSNEWDSDNYSRIIKEKWINVNTHEPKIIKRKLTYSKVIYDRLHLKHYGNENKNKNITTLGEDVFMEWGPHLFKGKNSHIVDNYVKDYLNNIYKVFPEKLIINNDIQLNNNITYLPNGKTWWDINPNEINELEIKNLENLNDNVKNNDNINKEKYSYFPEQYYIDTTMIDFVNKFKKIQNTPNLLWNKDIKEDRIDNNELISSSSSLINTTSNGDNDGKFIPAHRRTNFRSKANNFDSTEVSYVPLHLRKNNDSIKYSIKLYNFNNLNGVESIDILEWVREYDICGYIKITIPKNRKTGKLSSFVFLNFKNEDDKNMAFQILTKNRLKYCHSIISVEDTSTEIDKNNI
jgi:hypothetical protein